jgi:outer membrane protein OmpA-like peptidoglycan-associated protein
MSHVSIDGRDDPPGAPTFDVTDAGIVYRYPDRRRRLRIVPTTGETVNTVAVETWPSPTACVRLEHGRFAFDSSFPHPSLANELSRLFAVRSPSDAQGDKLAVFGHADPIGDEAYNKTLAGRRARAVYALLTREPATWDALHQDASHGDRWGIESLYTCLAALGYEPGPPSARATDAFHAAVRAFKADHGLHADPQVDRDTRLALFGAYMDCLTGNEAGTGRAYAASDFVGEGREPRLRGAVQGCGERNPAMVLSEDETKELAPDSRRDERIHTQRVNRRVLIFLFRPSDVESMSLWECPSADAGPDGCAKAAWSNRDERLAPAAKRRLVNRHGKTFGCKFYDWIARLSPCEALRVTVNVWIRDRDGVPYADPVDYELRAGSLVRAGRTDPDGKLVEEDVPLQRHVDLAWLIPAPSADPSGREAPPGAPVDPRDLAPDDSFDMTGTNSDTAAAEDSTEGKAPESGSGAPRTDAPRFAHFARVRLPLHDDDGDRRNAEWLGNLGYRVEPARLDTSMAHFAIEYGLAQNAAPDDRSKLLEDVQSTGRPAPPPSASDAPQPPAPPPAGTEQPPDEPAASIRPQCKCEDAPAIAWTPAAHTLVAIHPAYVPSAADKIVGLPADLLFEMPLFDGTFLGQTFSSGKRPERDTSTGLWAREWSADEPFFKMTEQVISGVGPELKERLDWAQKRLWFYYCTETTAAGKTPTAPDFLRSFLKGVSGEHSTVRSGRAKKPEISMHADGCAIDVGAGNAPFICVRGQSGSSTAKITACLQTSQSTSVAHSSPTTCTSPPWRVSTAPRCCSQAPRPT